MACHIRLVTERAKLGLPELQLGLIPGFAGTQRLPRYVGMAKAAEMLFTSEPISGTEAVQCGLANHAFTDEELIPKAKDLANKIAKKSPLALKSAIELLNYSKHDSYHKGVERKLPSLARLSILPMHKKESPLSLKKGKLYSKGNDVSV